LKQCLLRIKITPQRRRASPEAVLRRRSGRTRVSVAISPGVVLAKP